MPDQPAHIAFVHTAAVHEQSFNDLLSSAQARVSHLVRPDWLAQAQREGLSAPLRAEVCETLSRLAQTADVVVCSCTTLGPLLDELEFGNLVRIDYPMMMVAAATEGKVLLAVCLESTVAPSSELLERAYQAEGRAPNMALVRCTTAWPHFENQQLEAFEQSIADTVATAVNEHPDTRCVVLAQASMAAAADSIRQRVPSEIKVLRSPQLAVMHALLLAAGQES